jgi:hypothetical protein
MELNAKNDKKNQNQKRKFRKSKTQKKRIVKKIKKNKKFKYIHNNKTRHIKSINDLLNDLIMPKHISRYAYYSATFFLLNSLLAFYLKYYVTCVLLVIVYITTLLHWSAVKKSGIIRSTDIFFSCLTIANWTIFELQRIHPFCKKIWYITLTIIFFVFTMNEILFYYQVLKYSDKYIDCGIPYKKWHYFTIEYSNPNTKSRTISYYRSAFTHIFILHIFSQVVVAYCAISSYLQS